MDRLVAVKLDADMDRPKSQKKGPSSEGGPPKQAASPAQEATRARIASLESQLRKLKKAGPDKKSSYQVRCLEEDLRKAHSKLRRLLNEAERQRRRRERLRGGGLVPARDDDCSVMAALKSCTRFQDLVRELNTLGFNLTTQHSDDDGESMPEVEGVRVKVELIEGDEELETDARVDNTSSSSCSEIPPTLLAPDEEGEDEEEAGHRQGESYRRWFERQMERQQQWEEDRMRQQMEMARSLLDSVTATFLQGVEQILANLTAPPGRRFEPFSPEPPTS